MTTARINNHKNKGDSITVGFNPNSLKITKNVDKIELLATLHYDHTNISTIDELCTFINNNNNKIVAFTYKNICVVGHISSHHIEYTQHNENGTPTNAKVEISMQEQ